MGQLLNKPPDASISGGDLGAVVLALPHRLPWSMLSSASDLLRLTPRLTARVSRLPAIAPHRGLVPLHLGNAYRGSRVLLVSLRWLLGLRACFRLTALTYCVACYPRRYYYKR